MNNINNFTQSILVIDDDPDILDAITIMLGYAGHSVKTSEKVEYVESILNVSDKLPKLIILDVLLSGKDGRILCKNLKSDKKTKYIPIIMISAHPEAGKTAKEVGADDFLAKPFEMEELLAKVKKYIGPAGQ